MFTVRGISRDGREVGVTYDGRGGLTGDVAVRARVERMARAGEQVLATATGPAFTVSMDDSASVYFAVRRQLRRVTREEGDLPHHLVPSEPGVIY